MDMKTELTPDEIQDFRAEQIASLIVERLIEWREMIDSETQDSTLSDWQSEVTQ